MHSRSALVLIIILSAFAEPAIGTGTMRCATHVVDRGMTKEAVMQICGQPTARKDSDSYWYYDQGDSSLLVMRLFFVADKVEYIDTVPRQEM